MFKTHFPRHNTVWREKSIWGHCTQIPPVATGRGVYQLSTKSGSLFLQKMLHGSIFELHCCISTHRDDAGYVIFDKANLR